MPKYRYIPQVNSASNLRTGLIKVLFAYICLDMVASYVPSTILSARNRSLIINHNHCTYSNEEEARKDLEMEKEKLGLEKLDIKLRFDDKHPTACAIWSNDWIEIFLGKARNRLALRHELYHISKRVNGNRVFGFLEEIVDEWKATSYAIADHR